MDPRQPPGCRPGDRPGRHPGRHPELGLRGGLPLELASVSLRFGGITALDDVSLTARPGEVTALIGPNGSGKTRCSNSVSGFYRVSSGTITVDGRPIQSAPAHRVARLGVARTFQTPSMPAGLTTTEVVASGRFARVKPSLLSTSLRLPRYWRVRRDDAQQAAGVLAALGLTPLAGREAAALPLGTRRLVEVGRALAAGAQVLLLDEVASGLDEDELGHLAGILAAIRDAGVTVVLVEHNFDLVLRLADVIYVLAQGLIATGTPAEIRANAEVERITWAALRTAPCGTASNRCSPTRHRRPRPARRARRRSPGTGSGAWITDHSFFRTAPIRPPACRRRPLAQSGSRQCHEPPVCPQRLIQPGRDLARRAGTAVGQSRDQRGVAGHVAGKREHA